jgi:hypothetical protein
MKRTLIIILIIISYAIIFLPSPVSAAITFTKVDDVVDAGAAMESTWFGLGTYMGNINGDSFSDLIVSSENWNGQQGRIYVYYGGVNIDTNSDIIIEGEASTNSFSFSDTFSDNPIGDIDRDGFDEIVAGTYKYNSFEGKGYLFYGSSDLNGTKNASSADVIFTGNPTTRKGIGISEDVGDYNGDGNLDIAYGTVYANSNAGAVLIHYGNGTKSFDNIEDVSLSITGSTYLTYSTISSGDINGDGYDDLLFGKAIFNSGEMFIFYGSNNVDNIWDVKFNAEDVSDWFSRESSIGDINHDGYDDVCLGAVAVDVGGDSNAGRVYCFFGSSSFSGTKDVGTDADIIFSGGAENDNFGRAVDLYDINNDEHLDLLVGAYQTDGSLDGYVQIFLGNGTKNFDNSPDVIVTAASIGESGKKFGVDVLAGDINGDGWIELFLSSGMGGNGTLVTGRVHIFEVDHGLGELSIEENTTLEVTFTSVLGTANNTGVSISGVEISIDGGEWIICDADDGEFDEESEDFVCNISNLEGGDHEIRVRFYDENGLYIPSVLYATDTFTVDLPETGSNLSYAILLGAFIIVILTKNLKIRTSVKGACSPLERISLGLKKSQI